MNLLTSLKNNHPNIYALLSSFLLALWYNGIAGILNHYLPERGPWLSGIMLLVPIVIFLLDDGSLDEIYTTPENQTAQINMSQSFDNE